jgi:hypothetical protein
MLKINLFDRSKLHPNPRKSQQMGSMKGERQQKMGMRWVPNKEERMKEILQVISVLVIMAVNVSAGQDEKPPERWILEAETILAKIDSYSSIFHKQERVKGCLKAEEVVFLKFGKPFKVYMKWVKDPGKGREVLYVEGWNRNQIRIREGWMKTGFSLNFNPRGAIAMGGSRHPITDSGLDNFLKLLRKNLHQGIQSDEIIYGELGEELVYGSRSRKIEYFFPKERTKGYYCYREIINLDIESKMPIKARIYDWDGLLIENYGYESLKLNAGLTDADFNPKNPEYRFSLPSTKDLNLDTHHK